MRECVSELNPNSVPWFVFKSLVLLVCLMPLFISPRPPYRAAAEKRTRGSWASGGRTSGGEQSSHRDFPVCERADPLSQKRVRASGLRSLTRSVPLEFDVGHQETVLEKRVVSTGLENVDECVSFRGLNMPDRFRIFLPTLLRGVWCAIEENG